MPKAGNYRAINHHKDMRHYFSALAALAVLAFLIQGCGTARTRQPLPPYYLDEARVVGLPDVRGYGDAPDESLKQSAVESVRQELAAQPGKPAGVFATPTVDILSLSGGGADGAFGAGLLCGWTAHGDRPRFKLVTGISTGALSAPFAFLGPEYDAKLKEDLHHHQHQGRLPDAGLPENAPVRFPRRHLAPGETGCQLRE